EIHNMTGLTYKTNGHQWLGIESVYGGDATMGFRASYIIGTGTDYLDGAGVHQPSGYNTPTVNFDIGFTLAPYSKLEFKAVHLEQHEVKIPGEPVDINFLSTDAYTARFLLDDKCTGKLGVDAWFNYTRLFGDNLLPSKRQEFPFLINNVFFNNA